MIPFTTLSYSKAKITDQVWKLSYLRIAHWQGLELKSHKALVLNPSAAYMTQVHVKNITVKKCLEFKRS